MIFTARKITSIESLGENLRKHREGLGLSTEKAARLISAKVENIINIETNNYAALPAAVYADNLLKSYAKLLQLNPIAVIDKHRKEKELWERVYRRKTENKTNWLYQALNNFLNPRTLKYLIIFFLLAAVLTYIGFEVNRIVSPPEVLVFSPEDNLITADRQITILGQTEKEVAVQINDQPLLIDASGRFMLTLNLQNGLNIVKISARKKHSQETVVYKKIMVGEPSL